MANVHDWGTAPPLAGVTRPHAAAPRKAPEADERLEAQRKVLFRVLFAIAAALFLGGFFASALWVLAGFSGFLAVIFRFAKTDASIMCLPHKFEEGMFERELIPGSPEWHIKQIRDYGE